MIRKNICWLLAVIFLISIAFAFGCETASKETGKTQGGDEKPIELKFTTVTTTLHPDYKTLEAWAEEVNKRTDGRVEITLYPTNTLNPPPETYNTIKSGMADIGMAPVGYSASIMPLSKFFGDAMVGVSSAKEAAELWRAAYKNLPELQEEFKDIHVLWLYATTPMSLGTSGIKITKLEDFNGVVLRMPPGMEPLAVAWGASPINLPIGEIYEAMEKNVVNGFYGGAEMLDAMKLAELTDYVITNLDMVCGVNYAGMNRKVWDSLPADVQEVFNELKDWVEPKMPEVFDQQEEDALQKAIKEGCELVEIEDAEKQRIYAVSAPVIEEMAADLEKDGLPAKKILSELEKLLLQK